MASEAGLDAHEGLLNEVYVAFDELFAAQRRLRGRDAMDIDGITFAQFRLLGALDREGSLPAGRLATACGVSPASATQMLDGLERRGLVERRRSPDDRRVVVVGLTEEGVRRSALRRHEHRDQLRLAFDGLDDSSLTIASDALRRCAAYLDSL